MKLTLFDYGAGNLHSLAKAPALTPDVRVDITQSPTTALNTDVLVLPGVGAFGPAAARLAPGRDAMAQALRNGLPALGICLGMQLLFESSEEGDGQGLGLFRGRVERLSAQRVPHMGWNTVSTPLWGLESAYYAHSYACRAVDPQDVLAWSEHEQDRFPAAVKRGHVLGVQFHPEKSSRPGLALLRGFLEEVTR